MKILYHFTSEQLIGKVRRQGLTRGMIPWDIDPQTLEVRTQSGYQWLTCEKSYEQPWALLGNLPHARNRYRITIVIQGTAQQRLAPWTEICKRFSPESAEDLNRCPGWADWFVFKGRIPPQWFLSIERNPYGPADQMRGDFSSLLIN